MSMAKTVSITSGAETRALSSRRKLFGGAAAVVLGGGITAGVAASAADLVPVDADAELVSLCREFVTLELSCRALFDGPDASPEDAETRVAATPLEEKMDALLDKMEPLRAVSAAGVLARADALAAHNLDFGCSYEYENTTAARLLAGLLRDAAALAGRA